MLEVLSKVAEKLAGKGYTLRSGGANGADSAFEAGCDLAGGKKEIFLPWKKFNGKEGIVSRDLDYSAYQKAKEIAGRFHPVWDQLTDNVKRLHTRNVHQVLGLDCLTPSKFVLAYTEVTGEFGGTKQAMRIAAYLNIPVYNLAVREEFKAMMDMFKTLPKEVA